MAWAVFRLITRPGRLVTVLSNSKSNGQACINKAVLIAGNWGHPCEEVDLSTDGRVENMRMLRRSVHILSHSVLVA